MRLGGKLNSFHSGFDDTRMAHDFPFLFPKGSSAISVRRVITSGPFLKMKLVGMTLDFYLLGFRPNPNFLAKADRAAA